MRHFDAPEAVETRFYEVRAKSILNRVPEASQMPFRWTINVYRGCTHACLYCAGADTPILTADGRHKPIFELEVGEAIYGTQVGESGYRRYVRTNVLDKWITVKPAYRVTLEGGTELIVSGDHRLLSNRGWKHVAQQFARRARSTAPDHSQPAASVLGRLRLSPIRTRITVAGICAGSSAATALLRSYFASSELMACDPGLIAFGRRSPDLEALRRAHASSWLLGTSLPVERVFQRAAGATRREVVVIRASASCCMRAYQRHHRVAGASELAMVPWIPGRDLRRRGLPQRLCAKDRKYGSPDPGVDGGVRPPARLRHLR